MELIRALDSENADRESFVNALVVWIKKPHVANRRLCGSEEVFEINLSIEEIKNERYLEEILSHNIPTSFKKKCRLLNLTVKKLTDIAPLLYDGQKSCDKTIYHVLVRHLISKNPNTGGAYELVIKREENSPCAYFLTLCLDDDTTDFEINQFNCFAYKLLFDIGNKRIELYCHSDFICQSDRVAKDLPHIVAPGDPQSKVIPCVGRVGNTSSIFPSISWLNNTLLKKVTCWSQERHLDTAIKSLRLVNVGRYIEKYNELKKKYGRHLVDMWTECTDPLKFVYEDIGIAAYLLVLWASLDEENKELINLNRPKVFVDLGCGNGLLVYLLNAEGHRGYGVDIRKRKIWESLRPIADLKEFTVLPTEDNLFPDADWLIGNHSDELTPWIPVMAARCQNSQCQYFVLPCCPWDFTRKFASFGKLEFVQDGSSKGKYGEYLNFIQHVGKVCGFKVEKDVLRIPSTRRTCFVGLKDSGDSLVDRLKAIKSYIDFRDSTQQQQVQQKRLCEQMERSPQATKDEVKRLRWKGNEDKIDWQVNFRPRSPGEETRNLFKFDQSFMKAFCTRVMNSLLKVKENYIDVVGSGHEAIKKWNKGGSMPLSEICVLCDESHLKILKSACGGIQTALKNCQDVFSVKGGEVSIHDWSSLEFKSFTKHRQSKKPQSKTKSTGGTKTKICFFYQYHPDGCLLEKGVCKFAHGLDDLNSSEYIK